MVFNYFIIYDLLFSSFIYTFLYIRSSKSAEWVGGVCYLVTSHKKILKSSLRQMKKAAPEPEAEVNISKVEGHWGLWRSYQSRVYKRHVCSQQVQSHLDLVSYPTR